MDLNYLLTRHQISLHRSVAAPTREARHAHRGLADGYAQRIRAHQVGSGATARLADFR